MATVEPGVDQLLLEQPLTTDDKPADPAEPGWLGYDPTPDPLPSGWLGYELTPADDLEDQPWLRAEPVRSTERVRSVDVLRGVALLGILAMNIVGFAWPMSVYAIPIMAPDAGWPDLALWTVNHLLFDTKMMTLFSMLFGAGLVLMGDRAEGRHARWRGTYYRRVAWLLVIGLVHSYLIWDGDILVLYASCGFLLYPFRKLSPRTLIITGLVFNLLLVPLLVGFRLGGVPYIRSTAARAEARKKEGQTPTWWESKMAKAWTQMSKREKPKRERFVAAIGRMRASYPEIVQDRAGGLIGEQTIGFVLGGWWLAGGRMLIGMGLMKLGVFGAGLSRRTYLRMVQWGYGIGVPLMLYDAWHEIANGFFLDNRFWYTLDGWPFLTFYGSLPVVVGHIGLVMLACQSGWFLGLQRRLAAVGRMALSNYLFHSLVCTWIFYGYGLDYFGTLYRPLLYAIVITIWILQLGISPIWLESFRYGPAEWLWRSLTYWKLQPMRYDSRPAAEPSAAA
jgi:uncharacterized protein